MTFVVKMDKGGCPTMIQRGECEKQSKRCKKKKGHMAYTLPRQPRTLARRRNGILPFTKNLYRTAITGHGIIVHNIFLRTPQSPTAVLLGEDKADIAKLGPEASKMYGSALKSGTEHICQRLGRVLLHKQGFLKSMREYYHIQMANGEPLLSAHRTLIGTIAQPVPAQRYDAHENHAQ
uniref:Uncharacterized protein n=1 Tax=Eutreptiella gymnastica TaxID=73025 RepID=A0A7S4GGZ1_9EUGL